MVYTTKYVVLQKGLEWKVVIETLICLMLAKPNFNSKLSVPIFGCESSASEKRTLPLKNWSEGKKGKILIRCLITKGALITDISSLHCTPPNSERQWLEPLNSFTFNFKIKFSFGKWPSGRQPLPWSWCYQKKRESRGRGEQPLFFSRDKIDIKYKLVHEYSFGAVSKCPFFV